MIAALVVRKESFRAVLLPLDRALQLAAGPDDERLFRVDEGLHAEPAADIGRDQAQVILRNLQHHFGERVADEVRTLGPGRKR